MPIPQKKSIHELLNNTRMNGMESLWEFELTHIEPKSGTNTLCSVRSVFPSLFLSVQRIACVGNNTNVSGITFYYTYSTVLTSR